MAKEYSLYVRHEVYLRLGGMRRRQRERILSFLATLEHNPFQPGDYQMISPEGRPVEVKILGSFSVLYWADHAVSEVKVVDAVPADS